jgi:signal transduction histidine kinase
MNSKPALQLTVKICCAREQGQQQFDETFQESASTLLAEISHLKSIVSRFGEFSRMPQPQFQAVDLNSLADVVVKLHKAQLNAAGRPAIEGKLELSAVEPIGADPELLHRALSNLVLNAIEAMPDGGTLTLQTRSSRDSAAIEVSDTGKGLSQEDCARLFTPYYTSKLGGTGLGLAIVQSIVSDHGGRISVSSEPGRGTTFIIEVPMNRDKLSATETASFRSEENP